MAFLQGFHCGINLIWTRVSLWLDQRMFCTESYGKFVSLIRNSASTALFPLNKTVYAVECSGQWIPARVVTDNPWCAYFTYTNIYTLDVRMAVSPCQWVGVSGDATSPPPLFFLNEFQNWHFQSFFFFWCTLSYKWGFVWGAFLFSTEPEAWLSINAT